MHQRQDDRERGVLRGRCRSDRRAEPRRAAGGRRLELGARERIDTTINVLDGLLEFERATGGSAEVRAALRSGEEYLLERGLFRRKSSGEVVNPVYLEFVFPYYWRYEVLRALDCF